MLLKLCAPCLFGLEGPLGNELRHMGMKDVRGENGRVFFTGTDADLARANIRSRFAERILIEVGAFHAESFDELFNGVKRLPWERFIPRDGAFPVKGYSLNSALHSVPDCQRIIKKAASVHLGEVYRESWLPEDGELYQIQFSIMKDEAVLYLDTSGIGLHKRGYRPAQVTAPLRETLAAALVDIAGYRGKGDFCDPFCGSGTIAIEAALAAKGRAPGIGRSFSAEKWGCFGKNIWKDAREEARAGEFDRRYHIFASDIDEKAVEISRQNARRAGVDDCIAFSVSDAADFSRTTDSGIIVTNPPYGERLMDRRAAQTLARQFGTAVRRLDNWQVCVISSDEEFEKYYGERASKVRKLYNGMIKCGYYIYKK
ncbi:MAG: class I SAM-dependent RNA methyltransferase [Oscillospiraceae bacterium]